MDFIDLYIEALTGTRFHLKVSLQERVFAIKMWILRHEGIPASYQHLIFGGVELNDDATLASYEIPDKATLKLVVSMKGGPVRMRRIPTAGSVDPSWLEMRDLMDLNEDQLWDQAPGGKPVTVLLFRDGENVNFFRVVENSDGTYSPLSQTLNGNTLRSLFAEPDEESARKAVENDLLKEKMAELRSKMELKEKEKSARKRRKKRSVVVKPGSAGSRGSRKGSAKLTPKAKSPRILEIIDPIPDPPVSSLSEATTNIDDVAIRKDAVSRSSKTSSRASAFKLPPITSNNSNANRKYKVAPKIDTGLRNPVTIRRDNPPSKINISSDTESLRSGLKMVISKPLSARSRKSKVSAKPKKAPEIEPEVPPENPKSSNPITKAVIFGAINGPRPRTSPNLEFGKEVDREIIMISPALSTVSELGMKLHNEQKGTEIMNILNSNRSASTKLHRAKEAQRKGALLRGEIKPKPPKVVEIDLDDSAEDRILNALRRLSMGDATGLTLLEQTVTSAAPIPEPPETARQSRQRCSVCRKKLNVTNAFDCRCGSIFCSLHRYAEMHDCTFDYKAEGRRQIQESNPLVCAQKLPKI